VARLAAFLASDDAAFITGAEIAIDGGDGSVAA
jgi:NAD(P)-dependent dehydrogenase (short-subunit alcohol dehydrogenase family)